MADFCKQCSIDVFGEDSKDLAGLGEQQNKTLKPGYGWQTLCEGCGFTHVNEDGECISTNCVKKHGLTNIT